MFGLHVVDIIVIIAYFAMLLIIGYRAMKRIRNQEDYFLGGRRFGRWIQMFAGFGQATSAETVVTSTTMVATNGAAGVGAQAVLGVVYMPFIWMITPWYRRLRLLTLADFFTERYQSRTMAGFYALCQTLFFVMVAAMGFAALSKTVAAITVKPDAELTATQLAEKNRAIELSELEAQNYTNLTQQQQQRIDDLRRQQPQRVFSYVNKNYLIVAMAIVVLLYAVSGGLEAAFVTDMIQGSFILILTFMLIPFAMLRINSVFGTSGFFGPFQAMHRQLPQSFFEILGSPNVAEFTWYWIVAFSALGIINAASQANQLTAAGSAKDDDTARVGFTRGIFLKRYSNIIWGFLAMLLLVLYGRSVTDPDMVWGQATRELLGPLNIGLVGLMIACLLAALMSTADALMLTTAALLTHSCYRPLIRDRSEKHYVLAGRVFCLAYITGGVILAMTYNDVFGLFKLMLMFNAIIAAAFWLGMLWRRANRAAAWTSMIIMFFATVLLPLLVPLFPSVRQHPYLAKTTEAYVVTNTYVANDAEVADRQKDIDAWQTKQKLGQALGTCPQPLTVGQTFSRDYPMPKRSIFWQKGLDYSNQDQPKGKGILKVELVALQWLGWDLTKNSYSFNETLTALFRIFVPFAALMITALLTKPHDKALLDRFYGKMRTPVSSDPEKDKKEMEMTNANPNRFDHLRLFPHSNWEMKKWNRRDWTGQAWVFLGMAGIVVLIYLMVAIGR